MAFSPNKYKITTKDITGSDSNLFKITNSIINDIENDFVSDFGLSNNNNWSSGTAVPIVPGTIINIPSSTGSQNYTVVKTLNGNSYQIPIDIGTGGTLGLNWDALIEAKKLLKEEPKKERPNKTLTFDEDILNKSSFEEVRAYDLQFEFTPRGKHFAGIEVLKCRFRFKANTDNIDKIKTISTRFENKWTCVVFDCGTKEDMCVPWEVADAIKYLDIVLGNMGEFLVLKD